jgi:hypothetical protein
LAVVPVCLRRRATARKRAVSVTYVGERAQGLFTCVKPGKFVSHLDGGNACTIDQFLYLFAQDPLQKETAGFIVDGLQENSLSVS